MVPLSHFIDCYCQDSFSKSRKKPLLVSLLYHALFLVVVFIMGFLFSKSFLLSLTLNHRNPIPFTCIVVMYAIINYKKGNINQSFWINI